MRIIKHGRITAPSQSKFHYHAWPTVISLPDGALLAAWSGERLKHVCPFGKVLASRSADGGYTWSAPYVIQDTPLDDRDAGLCLVGDRIWMTSFTNDRATQRKYFTVKGHTSDEKTRRLIESYLDMITDEEEQRWLGSTLTFSDDAGHTFSIPVCDIPVSSPHGPTLLSNGEILYVGTVDVPAARFGKHLPDGVYATRLDTNGRPVGELQCIALHPGDGVKYYEPHAAQMPNGDILVAIRAERSEPKQRTIHLSRSTDGAKSFSVPAPTDWVGLPPHIFVATDNTVVLTYGRREAPFGIRARISRDSGYTWSEELVLRDDGVNGDLGYPSTTQNARGELVTVYYMKNENSLHAADIEYTVWTLD